MGAGGKSGQREGTLLPKVEAIGDGRRRRRKQPPCLASRLIEFQDKAGTSRGKGEKVV